MAQTIVVYTFNGSRSRAPAREYIPYRFPRWSMGTRRKAASLPAAGRQKCKPDLKDAQLPLGPVLKPSLLYPYLRRWSAGCALNLFKAVRLF